MDDLRITWPWCKVKTITGQEPFINLEQLGGILPGTVSPTAQQAASGGGIVLGQRAVVILVVGPHSLPVEPEIGQKIEAAITEWAKGEEVPAELEEPADLSALAT